MFDVGKGALTLFNFELPVGSAYSSDFTSCTDLLSLRAQPGNFPTIL